MKRGVYIVYDKKIDGTGTTGVNKKIQGQIAAFKAAGFQMETVHMDIKKVTGWKLWYRLPFTNILPYWRWFNEFQECDFIYFRHPKYMNMAFVRLMWVIKARNPKVKIIMEIPTYPYDKELLLEKKDFPLYLKDKIIRKARLDRYLDAIAVLPPEDTVFGVKALQIKNGFDFSKLSVRNVRENDNKINIVMCAMMEKWQGYERLITGLNEYYRSGGTRSIILHFIGDGEELSYYKLLVHEYGLHDRAVFYGKKDWNEIQIIYDKCDLGVSSLGVYKKGIEYVASLKIREYLAAGLPFIGAGELDVLEYDDLKDYVLCFSNDPSPIDMMKVVAFYDELYNKKSCEEIRKMAVEVRNLAEPKLNMQKAMERVLDFINEK